MSEALYSLVPLLERIADALERLAPPPPPCPRIEEADAFLWRADVLQLTPVAAVHRIDLDLLKGIERQRDQLLANTRRFAAGLPANDALLWGARGTGKSSLVKAVHAVVNAETKECGGLALIEVRREEIASLPQLLGVLRSVKRSCLLFCDDLSFDEGETAYKSLKAVLEGGIEVRPEHVLFYVTSNRRHLLSRRIIENERTVSIHADEAVEEKTSLSDRFGLWLGFHALDQDDYFAIVRGYVRHFGIEGDDASLLAAALEWSMTRGSRSGRVAWQFVLDYAGRQGVRVSPQPRFRSELSENEKQKPCRTNVRSASAQKSSIDGHSELHGNSCE